MVVHKSLYEKSKNIAEYKAFGNKAQKFIH